MSDLPCAALDLPGPASGSIPFGERLQRFGALVRELPDGAAIARAALGELADAIGPNRVVLVRTFAADRALKISHEWRADGLATVIGLYPRPDVGHLATLLRGLHVSVEDVCIDPDLAAHRAMLAALSIRSFAAVACIDDADLPAFAIVTGDVPRAWSGEELSFVRNVIERGFLEVERGKHRRRVAVGEESLRLATETAEVGVWDLDLTTGVLTWSDRTKALFGISPHVSCSMDDFYAGLHPDDRAATAEAFAAAIDPGRRADYHVQYRAIGKEDGITRWVAARGKGVFDGQGRCVRAIGTAIDITTHRENAQALREVRSLNTLILESSRDCIVVLDLDGNTNFVSSGGAEVMEVTDLPAIIGKWWPRVWLGDDHAAALRALDEARAGRIGRFQGYCPTHKGTPKWWDVVVSPLPGVDGLPERLVSIGRDITAQKTADILQAFRLSLSNGMLTLDQPDELLEFAGRLLGTHLGVERVGFAQVTASGTAVHLIDLYRDGAAAGEGTWPLAVFDPDDLAKMRQGVTTVCHDRSPADGSAPERPINSRAYVSVPLLFDRAFRASIYVSQGTRRRWTDDEVHLIEEVATRLWDSLERRRAQAALTASNERLEERIAQALAEREEIELALRQSQKMEAVGQLTGGIAHDFNNLLQVISGNLQLLSRDVAGQERAERRVLNAIAGAQRGAKLASQLLAFSRRQPLDPKVINVGRLVASMDEMLRRSLGETIEIETIVADGLWNTFADPAQIENAILNMAINARDAMRTGGKLTIEVGNAWLDHEYARRHADVKGGQYVVIALSDTGSGMTPDVMAKVFEPFFSTKPEGQGTGLGLSMVYGFVKQSGGHVKLYSEVGHGTTIKLYLPRNGEAEDDLVSIDTGHAPSGTATVLVTEDDDAVRETVVELLTDLGYRVLKANDAAGALAIIESGIPIDLLFTDVVMPGALKSPELARKVRSRYPHMAILFTSGYTADAIVHGGRLDAGVELLVKPYTREQLARKLRHVLARQSQPCSAPPVVAMEPNGSAVERVAALPPTRILFVEDEPPISASTTEQPTSMDRHGVAAAPTMATCRPDHRMLFEP